MRILLTAFEPYDQWSENSSWLALVELLKHRPTNLELITRRYPVHLQRMQEKLLEDLSKPLDAVLHLGQSPGASAVKLESVALNIAGCLEEQGSELPCLIDAAPLAYRSTFPVGLCADRLKEHQIPALISYNAGTFLCNATLYLSLHQMVSAGASTQVGFMHLPLATEQVARENLNLPSLPISTLATAVYSILDVLASASKTAGEQVA
ncbi:MAG: pyroglutamyl-peptidase I [Planctomycetales bacterium]|nr:pyroglutamyl-peptidase I [Planctomycetales bacterium]